MSNAINWKADIHAASSKLNALATEISALLSELPVHGAAIDSFREIDNILATVTDAIDAGTEPPPAA